MKRKRPAPADPPQRPFESNFLDEFETPREACEDLAPVIAAWCLRHALRQGMSRGFVKWVAWREERALATRRARPLRFTAVGGAWRKWLEYHAERRRVARFARRLLSRETTSAWSAWVAACGAAGAKKLRLRRSFLRLLAREQSRAWQRWVEVRHERARVRRYLRRMLHAEMARAVGSRVRPKQWGGDKEGKPIQFLTRNPNLRSKTFIFFAQTSKSKESGKY